MFKSYFKVALRNLKRFKAYSLINIAGLAVGMACCFLILLFVKDELSYDRYHKNSDQIYRLIIEVNVEGKKTLGAITPPPMGPALVNDFPEAINAARFIRTSREEVLISHGDKEFYERRFFFADPSVFDVFSFPLIRGDPEASLKEPYSVVITEEIAEKYFGDEDPLGNVITFNNKDDYKITGVLKNIPHNSHFRFDFLASFRTLNHYFILPLDDWGSCALYTYMLIPKGCSPLELGKRFPSFLKKYVGERHFIEELHLQPLTSIHLHSNLSGEIEANSDISYLYIFSAIAFLIMFVACINFVNLSTARQMNRGREVGMRKVLGAHRLQIFNQYLGESIFFAFAALPLTFLLVELFLPVFNPLVKKEMTVGYFNNLFFILAIFGLTLVIGIASGTYPALFLSAFQPIKVLKGAFKSGSARQILRSVLVLAQFAISISMIICTITINNQMNYIRNKKLGFDKDHIVILPIKERQLLFKVQSFKNELLRNSNILNVSLSSDVPGKNGINSNPFHPEGFGKNSNLKIANMRVDYDFLETLGIEIKEGRNFSKEFATDASEAFILNEAAVEKMGWESPLGKQLEWLPGPGRSKRGTVIGIIKDFHFESLHQRIEPLVLHIWPQSFSYFLVRIRPTSIKGTLSFIKNKWEEFAPNYPLVYSFLDEDSDKLYKSEQRLGKIFVYFSALSIFIACLGLFGLTLFAAEQRTKEIGIRKVLGASVPRIVFLLSKEFTKWVLLANIIAWPIAYYAMSRWLQNFAYRISIEPWIFVLAAALSFVVALLTVSYQAIKAALANPAEALRYE